ncbi:unnamed protein product [Anisakis simplex]|uniref:PCNA_C domain-containing protein n=1 Tax=Anisakis simplex TaxID=6269 RepID=A0A0M3J5Q3_ANISI|nr:unnamed protein product [Anisakis simplex]
MKTEMKISTTEFERYNIPKATEVTVNLKEFRALVNFAETYQAPISVYFDQPGSPMVLALESDVNFTAELVIATVDFDSSIIEPNFCTAAVESSNEIECASSLRQAVSSSVQQNAQKPIETQSQNRLSSLNSQMHNQQSNHSHNQSSTSLQHQNQSPQQISHDRRYSIPSPKSAPNQSQHDHRTHLPQTPPPPQSEAPDNTVLSQAVANQKSKSQSFAHGSVATSTVTMPPSSSDGTVESVKATNGHDEGSSVKKRCLRESNENENRNEISHSTVVENSVVENTINDERLYPNNNADSDKDDDDDVEMFPESPSPPPSKSVSCIILCSFTH